MPAPIKNEIIDIAIDKYQSGYPIHVCAKEIGISRATLRKYIKEKGISNRSNKKDFFYTSEYEAINPEAIQFKVRDDLINNIPIRDILKKYDLEHYQIIYFRKKFKIPKRDWKFFGPEVVSLAIKEYEKTGCILEAAKNLDLPASWFLRCINKNNIKKNPNPNRTYLANHNYFSKINSKEKAYWVGLLAADGCLSKKTDNNMNVIISLQLRDIELIEGLKRDLESEHPINIYTPKNKNYQQIASLSISSKEMFEDLKRAGLDERKSLTLKFPTSQNIPDEFIPDYIRGYFDGDGCITHSYYYYKRPTKDNPKCLPRIIPSFSFCGTYEFLISLREILNKNGIPCQANPQGKKGSKVNSYALTISGNKRCFAFYNFIYKNNEFGLKRKKEKLAVSGEKNRYADL